MFAAVHGTRRCSPTPLPQYDRYHDITVLASHLVIVAPWVGAKSLGIVMARSRIDAAVIICQLLASHLQIIKRKRFETYGRCSDADGSNGMSLALS
jgi:hypothetical protein